MWKSIPKLVALREEISQYINTFVEEGTENDYVTLSSIITSYLKAYPDSVSHHRDQIIAAIKDTINRKLVISVLISDDSDPDGDTCFSCGQTSKKGYTNAYQFIKRRDGIKCPFNYGCKCEYESNVTSFLYLHYF